MQCSALTFEGRGAEARVVPTHGHSWLDTDASCAALPVGLPDRRHPRAVPGRAPAGHERRSRRRRRPARSAASAARSPQRRPGDAADRQGHVGAELRLERGQPLRQGPLRFQLRPPSGPVDQAARPRRGWEAARGRLGHGPRGRGRRPLASASATAHSRSASSPRRGSRTRRTTCCRSSRGGDRHHSIHSCEAT